MKPNVSLLEFYMVDVITVCISKAVYKMSQHAFDIHRKESKVDDF